MAADIKNLTKMKKKIDKGRRCGYTHINKTYNTYENNRLMKEKGEIHMLRVHMIKGDDKMMCCCCMI